MRFEVPGRLPGLNEYTAACRANARKGARMKREAQDAVLAAIMAARLPRARGMVDVRITWVERDMRRDKDNIRFGAKFVLDALVEAGVIDNDGWAQIGDISDRYLVSRSNPRVVVELEEARPDEGAGREREE